MTETRVCPPRSPSGKSATSRRLVSRTGRAASRSRDPRPGHAGARPRRRGPSSSRSSSRAAASDRRVRAAPGVASAQHARCHPGDVGAGLARVDAEGCMTWLSTTRTTMSMATLEVARRPGATAYGATRSARPSLATASSDLGVRGQQRQQLGVGAVGGATRPRAAAGCRGRSSRTPPRRPARSRRRGRSGCVGRTPASTTAEEPLELVRGSPPRPAPCLVPTSL